MILVRDIMSKGVVKLKKTQTINEVNQLFLERVIDGAPVVDDNGKVIGVFTKTHLMRAMGKSMDTPIERLMTKNVISIGELMPVEEAMNIPVGRLPVVDNEGKMVGWLTRTDLASAFFEQYKKSIDSLRQTINATSVGLIAIDSNGNITIFNKAAEKLWNIQANKINGLHISEVFPVMKMDSVLRTGEPTEFKLKVDGELFKVEVTPITITDKINGVVAQFYKSFSD